MSAWRRPAVDCCSRPPWQALDVGVAGREAEVEVEAELVVQQAVLDLERARTGEASRGSVVRAAGSRCSWTFSIVPYDERGLELEAQLLVQELDPHVGMKMSAPRRTKTGSSPLSKRRLDLGQRVVLVAAHHAEAERVRVPELVRIWLRYTKYAPPLSTASPRCERRRLLFLGRAVRGADHELIDVVAAAAIELEPAEIRRLRVEQALRPRSPTRRTR